MLLVLIASSCWWFNLEALTELLGEAQLEGVAWSALNGEMKSMLLDHSTAFMFELGDDIIYENAT